MSDDKKVVFLAHRNDTPTTQAELLTCASCSNKTWIAEFGVAGSQFPHLKCSVCGFRAGYFGWVDDVEARTE
jgi:hypothetical protein